MHRHTHTRTHAHPHTLTLSLSPNVDTSFTPLNFGSWQQNVHHGHPPSSPKSPVVSSPAHFASTSATAASMVATVRL